MDTVIDRPEAMVFNPRWQATVHYRTDSGIVDVVHGLEEIGDLQELVEIGPHWDTIERIEIVRALAVPSDLTVEGAAKL